MREPSVLGGEIEGYSFQLFSCAQLKGRFNKKITGIEKLKTAYETELYTNDQHVRAKMYNFLLKFETQEQVKDCITKWTSIFGHNIQMDKWERM